MGCCGSGLRGVELVEGGDFTLAGRYRAKVVSVYDGDTVRVAFKRRGEMIQVSIRLLGIDTPELSRHPKELTAEEREFEREQGEISRAHLEHLLGRDRLVDLEIHKADKYGGRYLGTLWKGGTSINQRMLDDHYAVPYDGGKKDQTPGDTLYHERNRV